MQKIYTYLEHVYNSKMDYKFNQPEKKQRYELTNRHVRDYDGSKSVVDKMMMVQMIIKLIKVWK